MKWMYIMQGVPGSGKSTLAHTIWKSKVEYGIDAEIFSTDSYRFDREGKYVFDPEENRMYHLRCQRDVVEACQRGVENVIVDNTNITQWQADPYIAIARIYEYTISVVRVECPLDVAIARQAERSEDRAVPEFVIRDFHKRMERIEI